MKYGCNSVEASQAALGAGVFKIVSKENDKAVHKLRENFEDLFLLEGRG